MMKKKHIYALLSKEISTLFPKRTNIPYNIRRKDITKVVI